MPALAPWKGRMARSPLSTSGAASTGLQFCRHGNMQQAMIPLSMHNLFIAMLQTWHWLLGGLLQLRRSDLVISCRMSGSMPESTKQAGNTGEDAVLENTAPALGDPKLSAGEHDLLAGLYQPPPPDLSARRALSVLRRPSVCNPMQAQQHVAIKSPSTLPCVVCRRSLQQSYHIICSMHGEGPAKVDELRECTSWSLFRRHRHMHIGQSACCQKTHRYTRSATPAALIGEAPV